MILSDIPRKHTPEWACAMLIAAVAVPATLSRLARVASTMSMSPGIC